MNLNTKIDSIIEEIKQELYNVKWSYEENWMDYDEYRSRYNQLQKLLNFFYALSDFNWESIVPRKRK